MNNEFNGKAILVTGAAHGIGAAIASRFASEGANVVLADYDKAVLDTAKTINENSTGSILGFQVDVTNEEQVIDLYAKTYDEFGQLDVSVQNAGIITIEYLDKMPREEFDRVMQVNTTGVWLCCREAAKYMMKQSKGRLINTSSGQGRNGFIYTPHYAASKMGVIGITQSLAHELAPFNINVNAFCPGIIETNMWDYNDRVWGEILSTPEKQYKKGELMAEWCEGIPMKRPGQPKDVAGLVRFLASEDASYITGQTINVDGGLIMS